MSTNSTNTPGKIKLDINLEAESQPIAPTPPPPDSRIDALQETIQGMAERINALEDQKDTGPGWVRNLFTWPRILSIFLIALVVSVGYSWWQSEQGIDESIAPQEEGFFDPLRIIQPSEELIVSEGELQPIKLTNQSNVILQENFTVENETWSYSPPDQAKCLGEALLLEDNIYSGNAWATPGLTFEDFVLKVDSRWVGGTLDGEYGVEVRKNRESGEFLGLYLHNDGRYTIVQQTRRRLSTIIDEQNDAIGINGEINQIQIEVAGEQVRFFVNGKYLITFNSSLPPNGGIELVATAGTEGDLFMVGFDNLVITQNP